MGWGSSAEPAKLGFVADWKRGGVTMVALCEAYQVSRQAGYELLRRYAAEDLGGLRPRSRVPHRPGRAMAAAVAIIEVRRERPRWGPKKLRAVLVERRPELVWPAPSSIGELLRREGLSTSRRRRSGAMPVSRPFAPITAPNDLWCIDFKGWFRTRDGTRCAALPRHDRASAEAEPHQSKPGRLSTMSPVHSVNYVSGCSTWTAL